MDKAKILRLCNEIEKEISEAWNCDVIEYDKAGHIISIAQKISAEITAPPKSNGDKIRAMTDEELAEWFAPYMMCNECERRLKSYGCDKDECAKYALIYMRRKVSEDAFS